MKKILLTSIFISAVIYTAVIIFMRTEIHNLDIPAPVKGLKTIVLDSKETTVAIRQSFIPKEDNLSRIDIILCNDWKRDRSGSSLNTMLGILKTKFKDPAFFTLYAAGEKKLLYSTTCNVFSNNIFKKRLRNQYFCFAPIKDSKNKELYFEIAFNKPPGFDNLTLLQADSQEVESKLFINDSLIKGKSVVFSTTTTPKVIGFKELLERISQYKPVFFKTVFLFILAFFFIFSNVFVLLLLFHILTKKISNIP
ncbi:MAG: hypothetical protein A2231_12250 [Candidatus Firestonebacteria bacterium RIFOXYA2_FULL_40_8]|nr:MAG: hypothetical protein A2231_12250 [Candidatus Firestonebacteria bacterium RIFOXYA2_FULL_40_8]